MALSLKTPPLQSRNLRNTGSSRNALITPQCNRSHSSQSSFYAYEKKFFIIGAVSEARTRDPQLGKLMLYQLSYYRVCDAKLSNISVTSKIF